MAHAPSLLDLLAAHANDAQRPFVTFVEDDVVTGISYGELWARCHAHAPAIAGWAGRGQRVVLALRSPVDFVEAFFCVMAVGGIPVPVQPPRRNAPLCHVESIVAASGAAALITDADIAAHMPPSPMLQALRLTTPEEIRAQAAAGGERHFAHNDIAFLQFTSGSTSAPRGVVVSHRNLLHNQEAMKVCFRNSSQTVFAGWIPLFHDMGLIGNVLQSFYLGVQCVLISPVAFIERPSRLLRVISDYRITNCGMPNFGYEHCTLRANLQGMEGIDLRSWVIAYNGSEPIRARTMQAFAETFAPYGFDANAFYPCYGLAEGTLFVTGWRRGEPWLAKTLDAQALGEHRVQASGEAGSVTLVSSGYVNEFQQVKIVEPESLRPCTAGEVGEVWVAGPSIGGGYWGAEAATRDTFHGFTSEGEGPFMRTGDLGFIEDARLYITGRLKDLIIIRGRNHYPQDIEATIAECCPAFLPDTTAAFALEDDGVERLVIVQEVRREHLRRPDIAAWRAAIRDAVARRHELVAADIVFILPKSLPRTSSGKIQRRQCRTLYLRRELRLAEQRMGAAAEPLLTP